MGKGALALSTESSWVVGTLALCPPYRPDSIFKKLETRPHTPAARFRPGCASNRVPPRIRGRRKHRAQRAPAASRAMVENTRVSHHRHTDTTRRFLRDGLRLMARSPRGTGLLSPRRFAGTGPAKLDTSVGVSGPHAFAVRSPRRTPGDAKASIASCTQRPWRLRVRPSGRTGRAN